MKGVILGRLVILVVLISFLILECVNGSSFIRERLRRGYVSPANRGGYDEPLNRGPPVVPVLYSAPQRQRDEAARPEEQNEVQGTTTEFNSEESSQTPEEGISEDYQFGGVTQSPSGANVQESTGPSFSSSEFPAEQASNEGIGRQQVTTTTYRPTGYSYEQSRSIVRNPISSEPEALNEIPISNFRRPLDQQQVENSQHPLQTPTENAPAPLRSGYGNFFQSQQRQPNFEQIAALNQPTRNQYEERQGYTFQQQQQYEPTQPQPQYQQSVVPQEEGQAQLQPALQQLEQPQQQYREQAQVQPSPQFIQNRAHSSGAEIRGESSFPSRSGGYGEQKASDMDLEGLDENIVDSDLLERVQRIIEEHETQQKEYLKRLRQTTEEGDEPGNSSNIPFQDSNIYRGFNENQSGPSTGNSRESEGPFGPEFDNNVNTPNSDEHFRNAFESSGGSVANVRKSKAQLPRVEAGSDQSAAGFFSSSRNEGGMSKSLAGNSNIDFQPSILTSHFTESKDESQIRKGKASGEFRTQKNQAPQFYPQSADQSNSLQYDQNQGSQYQAPQQQQTLYQTPQQPQFQSQRSYQGPQQPQYQAPQQPQQQRVYLPPQQNAPQQERVYLPPKPEVQYREAPQQQERVYLPPQHEAPQKQERMYLPPQNEAAQHEPPQQQDRAYTPPQREAPQQQERVYLPPKPEVQYREAPQQQERVYLPPQHEAPQQQEQVYLPPQHEAPRQQEQVYLPPQHEAPRQQERVYLPPQHEAPQQQERVYLPPQREAPQQQNRVYLPPQNVVPQQERAYSTPQQETPQQERVYLPPQNESPQQQQRVYINPQEQAQPGYQSQQTQQQFQFQAEQPTHKEQQPQPEVRNEYEAQQPRLTELREQFTTQPMTEPQLNKPGYQTYYLTPDQARSSFLIPNTPEPTSQPTFRNTEQESNNVPSGPSQFRHEAPEQVQRYEQPETREESEPQVPLQYNSFASANNENSFSQQQSYSEPGRRQETNYLPPQQEARGESGPYPTYQYTGEGDPMIRHMIDNPNVITRTIVIHERPVQSFGASGMSNRAVITAEDLRGESREPESPTYQFLTASAQLSVENPVQETPRGLYNAPYPSGQEQGQTDRGSYGVPSQPSTDAISTPRPIYGIPLAPVLGPESLLQQHQPVSDTRVIDSAEQDFNSLQQQPNEYLPPRRDESQEGSGREVVSAAPSGSWDPNLFTIYRLPQTGGNGLAGYTHGHAPVTAPLVSNRVSLPSLDYSSQAEDLTTSYGHNVLVRRNLRKRFSPAVISPLAGFFSTNSKSS